MNKMNVNNINRKTLVDVVHTPESMDALQTYILQTKGLSATLASLMMYNLMATEFNTLLDTLVNSNKEDLNTLLFNLMKQKGI